MLYRNRTASGFSLTVLAVQCVRLHETRSCARLPGYAVVTQGPYCSPARALK